MNKVSRITRKQLHTALEFLAFPLTCVLGAALASPWVGAYGHTYAQVFHSPFFWRELALWFVAGCLGSCYNFFIKPWREKRKANNK
ncbi:MAG: hypothetical protein Q4G38_04315 [Aeriscardovia aeriphila]|nr:hypothetical protein [Aeriscardovia aeriphila]